MANNFAFRIQGGGVFSRLLQCAIEPLATIDFDNVYLSCAPIELYQEPEFAWITDSVNNQIQEMNKYGIHNAYEHLLNYILDQWSDYKFQDKGILPIGPMYTKQQPIELSVNYLRYKEVAARLRFKNTLVEESAKIFKNYNTNNILAVHLRIKDIDGHGIDRFEFDDYVTAIGTELSNYSYEKVFVAADNLASLAKLKQIFGDIIVHHDFPRSPVDHNDFSHWELTNYFKKHYWQTAIIDCLSLSYCKNLICRTSNFSNAAIVFGDYTEIYRL